MINFLADFPVIYETDVVWGDMDAFQHVNNVAYFRYFESARIRYIERIDMMEEMERTGVGPIIHSQSCRYRYPLTYPDRIQVGVRVSGVGLDRFIIQYRVVSARHDLLAAEGETLVVMYDYRRKQKAELSPTIREAIQRLQDWRPGAIPAI
ncbi:MAG: acyl-CoA thioesterase [Chloroflexi bacterium]|nr:acyl-CoA thioesterase [Chloroflexota bacterium]